VAFGIALVLGLKPLAVISGSMEPTIPVGSVVFSRMVPASELHPGDIVTVARPSNNGSQSQMVTHRLVTSTQTEPGFYELVLKGDFNADVDPQPYRVSAAGLCVWHLPWLGDVAIFLQSKSGLMTAAALAAGLIAVFAFNPDSRA
jgi:signal peptidase